jgi:HAD superfamily hydrolase (TIGR01509 family)
MIKYLFWDNDGVLVDTELFYFQAGQKVLREIGINLSSEEFVDISLRQGMGIMKLAGEAGLSEKEVETLRIRRNSLYAELLEENQDKLLIENAKETLVELKKYFSMGLVTSCRKEHFSIIHQSTGILPLFDFILANGDYPRTKPAPDPYLKALELSGKSASECLVIEDSRRGLAAAQAAGLKCAVIPQGLTKGENFREAWKIFTSLSELKEFLTDLTSKTLE